MLVLTRKPGEKVVIGGNITLTVVEVKGSQVRLALDAPVEIRILRGELVGRKDRAVPDEELCDPDLAQKPAEWLEDVPVSTRPRNGCHGNRPTPA
jgi:carbon storage regulator CsrA